MKHCGLFPLLLLSGSACVADPDALNGESQDRVGSEVAEIAGGTEVPVGELEAVVRVPFFSKCSGTLITDGLVLTAAHCVCDKFGNSCSRRSEAVFTNVRRVDDPMTPEDESATRTTLFLSGDVFVYPDMGFLFPNTNDLAVIRLDRPASEVVMVSPIPISATLPAVGSDVTIVGYGGSDGNGGECLGPSGTKRKATTQIDGHDTSGPAGDSVLFLVDGAIHVCNGDSGGPAINASGRVVGVASTGNNASASNYRAVAAYLEWLNMQRTSPGGRVGVWDLSGAPPAASAYVDNVPDGLGLLGWIDRSDVRLTGDFFDLGHDQVLYVNRGGAGGRLRIAGYADGAAPTNSLYWEEYGQSTLFNGWLDASDVHLVGDFLGRGHDQLLLINRSGSGGRVMIVAFDSQSPVVHYLESYGQDFLLNGWHDREDEFLVGDFFGDGYDSVLFVNRGPGSGRILIADFRDGQVPVTWRYFERYSDGVHLNGWHDAEDLLFAGDFRGLGRDQVLFINRGLGNGRVLIADFGDAAFPAEWHLYLTYAQATVLDGWLERGDVALAGNFRVGSRDQLALLNRTGGGPHRVQVADLSGSGITIPFQQTNGMASPIVLRIHDDDHVLAGDVRGFGHTQLLTLEVLEQ